ncbi:MAG: hypothetical protein M0D53_01165 [Flavobacterium sp. JAD_PAG50586_2]|nr:MAG: hypothetical protein M0D53_01165 [Flavobacterium sp. JAD_PAG50586_2]
MKKITFKAYKEAILKQYLVAQKSDASGILSTPTPAQLRDFCILKCNNGLSLADKEVMMAFFGTKNDETLKRSIEHCNIDKFRPVISFLKGEKETENQTRVGLAAIIVDFKPRPYTVFLNDGKIDDDIASGRSNNTKAVDESGEDAIKKRTSYKRWAYIALAILGLFSFTYIVKCFVWPEKQCMQWQKDHYEMVDCQCEINTLFASAPVIPLDEDIIELNNLKVCDTTIFFRAGKAIIWYCKVDGKPEFFDEPGFHPITGNGLRPVTQYIIDKYVKGK